MTAFIGSVDGRPVCVVVFNERTEAEAFKEKYKGADGVIWDRIDLIGTLTPDGVAGYINEELAWLAGG